MLVGQVTFAIERQIRRTEKRIAGFTLGIIEARIANAKRLTGFARQISADRPFYFLRTTVSRQVESSQSVLPTVFA